MKIRQKLTIHKTMA